MKNKYTRIAGNLFLASFFTLLFSCGTPGPMASLIRDARESRRRNRYSDAAEKYNTVLREYKGTPREEDIRTELGRLYGDWAAETAMRAEDKKDLDAYRKALILSKNAETCAPRLKGKMEHFRERKTEKMKALAFRLAVDIDTIDPEANERKLRVDTLMRQGDKLFNAGSLAEARDTYNQLLVLDPYNEKAVRTLKRVEKRLFEISEERREVTELERISESEWKYAGEIAESINDPSGTSESALDLSLALDTLVIPKLSFEKTPLDKVFRELGIIAFKSGIRKKDFFIYESFDPADKSFPSITFKAKNIPFSDAVEQVCKAVGLLHETTNNAIIIRRKD